MIGLHVVSCMDRIKSKLVFELTGSLTRNTTNDFHLWAHELFMTLRTWASRKVSGQLLAQRASWVFNLFSRPGLGEFAACFQPITYLASPQSLKN